MEKVTGKEVTKRLVSLEERNDLGFDVELYSEMEENEEARGVITFMNVGFTYSFNGDVLLLELSDREAYFDHTKGMSTEDIQTEEENVQVKMEDLIEIATVVRLA
ncbi:hypothetical protein [Rossellomorea marisflavi]|uniref:hypothetical protein n=1 Tax=Rossellomorea marisflavi TaxID=189381 RepID=UPI003F9F9AB2